MNKVWRIGEHEVRYEEDAGFIVLVHVGVMGPDEVRAVSKAMDECMLFSPPGAPAFLLADSRKATGMNVNGREVVASKAQIANGDTYVAVFGAPFAYRVVLNLVFRGVGLITDKMKAIAVADEAEARVWLTEKRQSYLASREQT